MNCIFRHHEIAIDKIVGESAICINCQVAIGERSREVAAIKSLKGRKREKEKYKEKMRVEVKKLEQETKLIPSGLIASDVLVYICH